MDNKTTPPTSIYTIAQNSEKIKQQIAVERKKEDEKLVSFSDAERKFYLFEKYQNAEQYALENKLGLDIINPKK